MSPHELSRVEVMQQLKAKRITQRQAAEHLGLTVRQVKRLWRAFRRGGAKALRSKQRGRASNHQLAAKVNTRARKLLHARYADFGPTLAHEKLTEVHHLHLSVESVRRLLIAEALWQPHRAKPVETHPLRARRPRRGELVQIDGSPFAWFEERGPACSLLVYSDDATGQLGELFFAPTETTFSYFAATQRYLARHGRPAAFYSDKHSIFRLTDSAATTAGALSQFGRATPAPPSGACAGTRHPDHLRQQSPSQGPRGTRQPNPPGSTGQRVTLAAAVHDRTGQYLSAGVHG